MTSEIIHRPGASRPSAFDSHNPPQKELVDSCVHCGFCLPACPTYVLWGEEMDSPRGRIYMMNKAAKGHDAMPAFYMVELRNASIRNVNVERLLSRKKTN